MSTGRRIMILDTTLRDGEQSPGASMDLPEKLQIATQLAALGVDVIEAGFAASSVGEFEAIRAIGRKVEGPIISSFARCTREDIDRAGEALRDAPRKRIQVCIATSPIHREHKLKMSREEVLKRAVEAVQRARTHFDDVQFAPEDASRTELDYLTEVCERTIEAGASTLNITDTVGYAMPAEFGSIIRHLKSHVRGIDKAVISVHCHDDLGHAVANSLTAVVEGAQAIDCTINGIGERAGNCALEEVAMAIKTRQDFYQCHTGIQSEQLYPTSTLVSQITRLRLSRNKAIVGENAFSHEAGMHQHGVLMHRETYEIMRPQDVGIHKGHLVLGKHSGRHGLRERLRELGYEMSEEHLNLVFEDFKMLADRKKTIYDADLESILAKRQLRRENDRRRAEPLASVATKG
jgi:2-isopropylmalate synthase